jgi:NAD(P)-dependent dehydrogenase (short-subunit alcohol dehydrogenase family)
MSAAAEASPDWLRANDYTHVYYFASPHIGKNAAQSWDEALFRSLESAYAGAFEALVERVLASRAPLAAAPRFFYPSTVYLDAPEPGFAEYAAAKAAGEAVARRLAQQHAVTIAMPRLPRLRTDQTAALFGAQAGDPVPVLLEMVRRFVG